MKPKAVKTKICSECGENWAAHFEGRGRGYIKEESVRGRKVNRTDCIRVLKNKNRGRDGASGPQGPAGAIGMMGRPGTTGEKGDKGDRGDTGIPPYTMPNQPWNPSYPTLPRGPIATYNAEEAAQRG